MSKREEDLQEIIRLQDEEITLLTGALQCMSGDAPCVKLIKKAMETKKEVSKIKRDIEIID